MTIWELGQQYLMEEKTIREKISKLRPLLLNLEGKEKVDMEKRINSLYIMALNCKNTGDRLLYYYNKGVDD